MSLIRIAVAGLVLVASASVAGAQGAPQGHEGHGAKPAKEGRQGRGAGMMLKGITLSADQQAKLDAITARYRAERQPMSPDGARPDEGARAKMMEAMEKQNAEIRAILTADQQKLFDANVAEMKKRREMRRSTPPRT